MTEPNRQSGENEERIIEIEMERLRPFKEHPFQVKDDKEMFLLQESIEKYGILNPLIVRPVPDGYYEIISGHRRKHAAEKLGYRKVPVIIRVLSEDDSILSMVDSNLHRERISYSVDADIKGFFDHMKHEWIKVWLYANRDQPLKKLMGMLNLKLTGHYRYYGISFNGRMISNYKQQVRELLFKVLNRRSDRKSYTREGFIEMLKYYPLAMPKIYVSLF